MVISNETRILKYSCYVVVRLLQQFDAGKTHLLSPKAGVNSEEALAYTRRLGGNLVNISELKYLNYGWVPRY